MKKHGSEIDSWEQTELKKFESILLTQTCLCCFTEVENDILMWSHYADKHKGICLRFGSKSEDGNKFITGSLNVNYPPDENFPEVNWYKDSNIELVKKIILTKSKHWGYEKERRKIDFFSIPGYKKIPDKIITGIILGCRFEDKNLDFIQEIILLYKNQLSIYKAKLQRRKYKLEIEQINI